MGNITTLTGLIERIQRVCGVSKVAVRQHMGRYSIFTFDSTGKHRLIFEVTFFGEAE